MQKLALLLFSFYLIACNYSPNVENKVNSQTSIEKYNDFLNKECKGSIWEVKGAMNKYVALFGKETSANRDSAFDMLITFANISGYNFDKIVNNNYSKNSFFLNAMFKYHGFQLYEVERKMELGFSIIFALNELDTNVSNAMRKYYSNLFYLKNTIHYCNNLPKTPDSLIESIILWEKFIDKYPNFIYNKPISEFRNLGAKEMYRDHLNVVLKGNRTIYSYTEDKGIDPYFNKAWAYLAEHFPNSKTNKIVSQLRKSIKSKNLKEAQKLYEFYKKNNYIQFIPCCGLN